MNPLILYMNSLLHFVKEKYIIKDNIPYSIRYYFLDKRFLRKTSVEQLEAILSGTRIKDLDDYYYEIITLQHINNQKLFYTLDKYKIIISLNEFCNMLEGGY